MRLPSFLRMYEKLVCQKSILRESNEMKGIHLLQVRKQYVHIIPSYVAILFVVHVRLQEIRSNHGSTDRLPGN